MMLKSLIYRHRMVSEGISFLENMESMRKDTLLTLIAIVWLMNTNASYCQGNKIFNVKIPSKFCNHCQGFSGIRANESNGCPLLRNDTFEILNQVGPLLGQIKDNILKERDLVGTVFGSDTEIELSDIQDLKNIEKSSISKYLRGGTEVEKIIHHSYGRIMMQIAYFNLYKDILERNKGMKENLKDHTQVDRIIRYLETLSCKLYDYTAMLGINKIKKKMCKFIGGKSFTNIRDEKEYISSIVQLGVKSLEETIDAIESLNSPEIIENCQYECSAKMKIFLRCREDKKQLRNAPKGRKNRKDRKERKNRNKSRRQNKGRKRCKKNKGEEKDKRKCKNRRRSKKKSQRRKNICFKCK